ncbi:hypothetical protein JCM33374_g3526 [Metschnikowia sp. JCM 33374]|nr:hypothetical protein JCM33374_g3526 [Metschnikowia sp. JCM 33374]
MNPGYFILFLFASFASTVVGEQNPSPHDLDKVISVMEAMAAVEVRTPEENLQMFQRHGEAISKVVADQMIRVSGLLIEVPAYFDVDLNEILQPHGLAVNPEAAKRDGNLHKRGLAAGLRFILGETLAAIGISSAIGACFFPPLIIIPGVIIFPSITWLSDNLEG